MSYTLKMLLPVTLLLLVGSWLAAQTQQRGVQERKPLKPVTRAKKPVFQKKNWEGVFFEDLFAEGLVGERPTGEAVVAQSNPNTNTNDGNEAAAGSAGGWNELIDGAILENEVKRLQQSLAQKLTTAGRFKTTHVEIRESYSMLAMVFGIIGQFEGDVRWKDSAVSARFACMDAAKSSRTPDPASFKTAKRRSDSLTDMVRGSKFPDEPRAKTEISDWSMVADRDAIMKRLEASVSEILKEPTSSKEAFLDAQQKVVHEAGMIAAMGRVLQQTEMLDSDDDDYNAFSQEMSVAAKEMKEAAGVGNYELVEAALNRINQSCVNCHADFR